MSDTSVQTSTAPRRLTPRPVSLVTIVFLFLVFAAGLFVARHYYSPAAVAPYNAAAENLPKDLAWRQTAQARRDALQQLKTEQTRSLDHYAWIDQSAGAVRLPIERAMELTAEKYGKK